MSPRLPSDVSLSRDARGATIIEFALIAPIFCTMALMIVQSGIAFQRWNALQTTARTTARCLAISSPRCTVASGGGSADPAIAYAVKVAAANGIGMVTAGMVRTETTAPIGGLTYKQVSITLPVTILGMPVSLNASDRFPQF